MIIIVPKNIDYKNKRVIKDIEKNISSAIAVYHTEGFYEELNNLDINVAITKLSIIESIVHFEVLSDKNVEKVIELNSVIRAESIAKMALLGDTSEGVSNGIVAQEEIGVTFFKNNPNINLTGYGTLIAIVDTGIDYLHKDFIYPDGTSKIVYLWDQTKEGNPPKGFFIGTEYTREDINKAIKEDNRSLSKDEDGHGTIISGICAGLGNVNKEYEGIAPDAELIVVKLAKIQDVYTNVLAGIGNRYATQKAIELDRPIVLNTSLGSNNLAGYTSRANSEKAYFSSGVCIIAAAGNEGDTQTHANGRIKAPGEIEEVEFQIVEEEKSINIDIWISRPDRISLIMVSPSGEETKEISQTNFSQVKGRFDLENTDYIISYIYPTTFSGQQNISITLKRVKEGIWKIKLKGIYISSGEYNVYLPNRVFLKPGTKFREASPLYTINYPAIQDDLICVGTYNSFTKGVWKSSSRGPNIVNRMKPDIVAPGVNIIGPYPNNTYGTITGSSAAAAQVTGVASLYFQYMIVEEKYKSKGFTQMLRTFMEGGATRNTDISYPNTSLGYGILNMKGMFNQLK